MFEVEGETYSIFGHLDIFLIMAVVVLVGFLWGWCLAKVAAFSIDWVRSLLFDPHNSLQRIASTDQRTLSRGMATYRLFFPPWNP